MLNYYKNRKDAEDKKRGESSKGVIENRIEEKEKRNEDSFQNRLFLVQ